MTKQGAYNVVCNTIQELEKLLAEYNPLQVISAISKLSLVKNPETSVESTETISESLVEYLMSLALSRMDSKSWKTPTGAIIKEVFDLWTELSSNLVNHFGSEITDKTSDSTEVEVRFNLILGYHLRRGVAYQSHIEQTFLELFEQHSQHLQDTIGFSAQEFHEFMQYAEAKITSDLNREYERFRELLYKVHERFKEWIEEKALKNETNENLMKQFQKENPDLADEKEEMEQVLETQGSYEVFEIQPQNETHRVILEALSCGFGDNEGFLTPRKWRGWPTNDTIISKRPIVKVADKYYLFHLPMMSRSRISLLENLLEFSSPDYFNKRYLPSKDRCVEKTALQLIGTLLPMSDIYSNLYYYVKENGHKKRVELDGLTIYDDCLLILESKAGMLPLPARRGAITGLKHNLKKNLKVAHLQATRAFRYVRSASAVPFFNEKGKKIVSVRRDQFKHIFLVIVNFEPLYALSSHLSSAQRLGLLSGKEWPWFVYLNDLRVISEIIEHPSTFLHYLKRRIALNDHTSIHANDELDYFMNYVNAGLFFTQKELEGADVLIVGTHTDDLDAYYSWRRGERSKAPKPRIKMHPTFQALISRLENEKPLHFSSACLHLLDSDEEARSTIAEGIMDCEHRFNMDEEPKSIALRIDGTGLLLGCMKDIVGHEQLIKGWGNKWLDNMGVDYVTIICWSPPIKSGEIQIFLFQQ